METETPSAPQRPPEDAPGDDPAEGKEFEEIVGEPDEDVGE
jgi:hypothetical protein